LSSVKRREREQQRKAGKKIGEVMGKRERHRKESVSVSLIADRSRPGRGTRRDRGGRRKRYRGLVLDQRRGTEWRGGPATLERGRERMSRTDQAISFKTVPSSFL
jgi:hypothetical protein